MKKNFYNICSFTITRNIEYILSILESLDLLLFLNKAPVEVPKNMQNILTYFLKSLLPNY